MKIGIDIRCLQTSSKFRGIGSYTYNLVSNILSLDTLNKYFLLLFKDKKPNLKIPENISKNLCYFYYLKNFSHLGWLIDKFFLGKKLKKYNLDIVHFTSPFEFFFGFDFRKGTRFKKIVTVYDLTPYYFSKQIFSEMWRRRFLRLFYFYLLRSITYADKIITISKSTAKDLMRELNIPEDKIEVIYPGVNERFFYNIAEEDIKKIKEKYRLPSQFLLYIGGFNPNKNLAFLINIIRKIKIPLVIVGHRQKKDEKFLYKQIKGIENLICFTEFVPDEELPIIYRAAKIFVFPSLYEGFGFPPLEAMTCGTPVISSNSSSLPEVIGDAGILINPTDKEKWIKEILDLWENKDLQKELSVKGTKRAKEFSWRKTALATVETYEKLIC